MVSAAWIVCKNHIFIIRGHHDCSRDMEDELPNIACERYFPTYCFRGSKQLKHVSCRLPFQKCTKSVYCQHMSIYLLALRKWLLLIVFNQADACMPDLQITCYHYSVSGRRKQSCNCSTEKCLSFAATWQHLQTGVWDCSFSSREAMKRFRLVSQMTESFSYKLFGMLLCLAFGNKERRSKKASNSAGLPSYLQVVAGLRELHHIANVGSSHMDWRNAGWKGSLEVMLSSPMLKAGPSLALDQVSRGHRTSLQETGCKSTYSSSIRSPAHPCLYRCFHLPCFHDLRSTSTWFESGEITVVGRRDNEA